MKHLTAKAIAFLLLLYLSHLGFQTFAQHGNPFLTQFKLPNHISSQNWRFEQGENGLMFILNQKALFAFDGYSWDNMGVPGRPITMQYFKGSLFFCSDKGVGRFIQDANGQYISEMLIVQQGNDIFYKFAIFHDALYVVSPQTICSIEFASEVKVDTFYFEKYKEVFLSDIFPFGESLYHVKNRALIYCPKPDGGFEMVDGLPLGEDFIFSFVHNNQVILGSTANKLYRFNGAKLEKLSIKDQDYLNASQLNGGISIDNSTIALSTLNGGCLLVNSVTGETVYTLNLSQGLPDDEVYALGKDRDGGIWISHAMGISRADLRIPVRTYNYYPGLKGNIFSCIEHSGKLYVGCSEGLFVLSEFRDYKEVEVVVKQPINSTSKPAAAFAEQQGQAQESTNIEVKKKRFLSRLFSRKSSSESEEELVKRQQEEAPQQVDDIAQKRSVKKKIYELQSLSHGYKKIQGIDGKVKQLFTFQHSIFASTSTGLFEVTGEKAQAIVSGMYIVYAQQAIHSENTILFTTDMGVFNLERIGAKWVVTKIFDSDNQNITSIVEINSEIMLASSEFDVFLLKKEGEKKYSSTSISPEDSPFDSPLIRRVEGNVMIFTPQKVYGYNAESEKLELKQEYPLAGNFQLSFSQEAFTWIRSANQWELHTSQPTNVAIKSQYINLFDNPIAFYVSESNTLYVVNDYSQIYKISYDPQGIEEKPLSVFLKDVTGPSGQRLNPSAIRLSYSENSLKIRISAPYYIKGGDVFYQYLIKGGSTSWSEWERSQTIDLPFLPTGKFAIQIRARDILGNTSEVLELNYEVKPPFWKTPLFFIACAIAILVLFVVVVVVRERKLKHEKEVLEEKVRERTRTIEDQNITLTLQRDALERSNKEIMQQKEEITTQRDEIEAQRDRIFKQNEEITQSIVYARRIQAAVMPSPDVMSELLPNHFLLFRPRDIVSGDFYWMSERNGRTIVVAADCTGHGVPGAFMSMMGVSFLNDIVNVNGEIRPDLILNELREKIKTTLWQTGKSGETKDGMDIAICCFEPDKKSLKYAGAYNSLYLTRNGELIEYKADKMPVGIHVKEKEYFTCQDVELKPSDNLFIFSDGYVSQFGGTDGKKFMAKPFKDLLASISSKPLMEQHMIIEKKFDEWKGDHYQVDDVLVIGIRV